MSLEAHKYAREGQAFRAKHLTPSDFFDSPREVLDLPDDLFGLSSQKQRFEQGELSEHPFYPVQDPELISSVEQYLRLHEQAKQLYTRLVHALLVDPKKKSRKRGILEKYFMVNDYAKHTFVQLRYYPKGNFSDPDTSYVRIKTFVKEPGSNRRKYRRLNLVQINNHGTVAISNYRRDMHHTEFVEKGLSVQRKAGVLKFAEMITSDYPVRA